MLFVTETILYYGLYALANVALANMNKVTLELGIKVGEKMRVPFVKRKNRE
jgi:hypothetical protein